MSSIKLDLKNFKHKSSDKETTTLEHEKHGHLITLAHKALSPENREQLAALAKLAEKSSTVHTDDAAKGMEQAKTLHKEDAANNGATIVVHEKQQEEGKVKGPKGEKPQVFAKGGEVQKFANGTDTLMENPIPKDLDPNAPAMSVTAAIQPKLEPTMQPKQEVQAEDPALARKRELYNLMVSGNPAKHPMNEGQTQTFSPDGKPPQNFDAQDWANAEKTYAQQQADNAAQTAALQQKTIAENQARTAAGLPALPVPNVPDGPQIPGSPGNPPEQKVDELPKPQPQAPQQGNPGLLTDPESMMHQGYQQQMAGINKGAEAAGKLGEQQATLLDAQAKAQQDAQAAYKNNYDDLDKERKAHMEDIKNGHIDPNQYWTGDPKTGEGGHSKIAAGIGMILAGFNPTSSPNAAIGFLNKQMENNLEAQKQNLTSKQNLLAANLKQFGNLKDATDMTRLMQNDIVHNQLLSAAAKAATPMQKAAAMQAAGQLEMQSAPLFQQFAMRRAMMSLANSGNPSDTHAAEQMIAYARMTNPEMAKEMESRLVPGVGMAVKPVPEGVMKEMVEKQSLNTAAQDLLQYSKKHTNLIPGTADYNFGVTKALAFQQKVREGLLGTVFRESEKPLLEKFVNDNPAGAFKSLSTQPQLKAILESNAMGLNAIKKSYGLPTPQAAPEIKVVNGVKYMRGPDGKAIPVK